MEKIKTKIVCTIGPASNTPDMIEALYNAGMRYARVNCSHGGMQNHKKTIEILKKVRSERNLDFKIMLDTKGPDIRIGRFNNYDEKADKNGYTDLVAGQEFTLTTKECLGDNTRVFVALPQLPKKVKPSQVLLLNDGMIKMTVKRIVGDDVICNVENSGRLLDRKTLFVPDCDLGMPFLADYDKFDLVEGHKHGAEYVAASFVNSIGDLEEMQQFMRDNNCVLPIISKIESSGGMKDLEKIIAGSEGIMVARGDLGVEYPVEKIPSLQKQIIEACNKAGKFVIVATEMMESMRENPRPTRAEVTDVYMAIKMGADAIMTSAETAAGKYPDLTVHYMARIAKEAEGE